MIWQKKGLIFKYTTDLEGTQSHCQHPTPLHIQKNEYRIFFGSRNQNNQTLVYAIDMNIITQAILKIYTKPILSNGQIGYFDSDGIYPSCVIKKQNEYLMYTLGFTKGNAPLYYTRIGLATGSDGLTFNKYSAAPLLNTSDTDPWLLTGPFVMQDEKIYRMWYVSGHKWDADMNSYYHIKYAESKDGLHWSREGVVSIDYAYEDETNIARPWVLKEDGIYKAWFSYKRKNQNYRIGYAESKDGGFVFERKDHLAGIHPSDEHWENDAVAYPAVISHKDKKYMFYNGNQFGKEGIALAVEK